MRSVAIFVVFDAAGDDFDVVTQKLPSAVTIGGSSICA
jgi:hypothetical protein